MKKITQNFYQVKANKAVHRWFIALCLGVVFCMGVIGQANAQSRIYFTQYAPAPAAPAVGTASWTATNCAYAATTASTPWLSFDNVNYPHSYVTSSSSGFVTLNFSTPLTLTASGSSKGKIIVHWGSVSSRRLDMSINGAAVVNIDPALSSANRSTVRTVTYDLPAGTPDITSIKFISSGGGAVNVFDVEIQTYDSLSSDSFKVDSSADVYSNGSQVFVSNVKSNTTVAVYSVSGALVKTLETSSDVSFDLNPGVYVVKAKSAEGEKSVKILVK